MFVNSARVRILLTGSLLFSPVGSLRAEDPAAKRDKINPNDAKIQPQSPGSTQKEALELPAVNLLEAMQ